MDVMLLYIDGSQLRRESFHSCRASGNVSSFKQFKVRHSSMLRERYSKIELDTSRYYNINVTADKSRVQLTRVSMLQHITDETSRAEMDNT